MRWLQFAIVLIFVPWGRKKQWWFMHIAYCYLLLTTVFCTLEIFSLLQISHSGITFISLKVHRNSSVNIKAIKVMHNDWSYNTALLHVLFTAHLQVVYLNSHTFFSMQVKHNSTRERSKKLCICSKHKPRMTGCTSISPSLCFYLSFSHSLECVCVCVKYFI